MEINDKENIENGEIISLTSQEAKSRLETFGPNQITKPPEINFWKIVKEEITEPMIVLLLIVGIFYSFWGNLFDSITIFLVIGALVLVETITEYRAKKAIRALAEISSPKVRVIRDKKITDINFTEVVPGDILIILPGTKIAADAKILEATSLNLDESILTGESFSVEKNINDEIYAGTLAVNGEGKAKVFATGQNTRIGKISAASLLIKEPKTPLQQEMNSLVKKLVFISLFFSILIPVIGYLQGNNFKNMFLTGLALAFAVIPEELPIITTMILGVGAYKLSQKKFLIKKIKAAEVLGNINVILADKTGTMTADKMEVVYLYPENKKSTILEAALANVTEFSTSPTEEAILRKAKEINLSKGKFGKIIRERTFDSNTKTRSSLIKFDNHYEVISSGAPEEIIARIRLKNKNLEKIIQKETAKGRRLIAVANKIISEKEKNLSFEDLEKNMKFVGLISIEDPIRENVPQFIETARRAGIRSVMVTGDHPNTAAFIAKEAGINTSNVLTGDEIEKMSDSDLTKVVLTTSVFARISPEQKYRLVKAFQNNNERVAVTGDGVNDTLALKAADLGIAMGIKGTDAAKEAADVILANDEFSTIAQGIFEGRKFYNNLKKGISYYLSVKIALISIFLFVLLFKLPMPFDPIQIIVLELFMDLAASIGFIYEPEEKNIYTPFYFTTESLFSKKSIKKIIISAAALFAAVAVVYLLAIFAQLTSTTTRTYAFSSWLIGTIFLAYFSRREYESIFEKGVFSNKLINYWALAVIVFFALIIKSGFLSHLFKLTPLNTYQLIFISVITFVVIALIEIFNKENYGDS